MSQVAWVRVNRGWKKFCQFHCNPRGDLFRKLSWSPGPAWWDEDPSWWFRARDCIREDWWFGRGDGETGAGVPGFGWAWTAARAGAWGFEGDIEEDGQRADYQSIGLLSLSWLDIRRLFCKTASQQVLQWVSWTISPCLRLCEIPLQSTTPGNAAAILIRRSGKNDFGDKNLKHFSACQAR